MAGEEAKADDFPSPWPETLQGLKYVLRFTTSPLTLWPPPSGCTRTVRCAVWREERELGVWSEDRGLRAKAGSRST